MRLYKRGDSGQEEAGMSPAVLIGIVAAAMLILATLPIAGRTLELLKKQDPDQKMMDNYGRLVESIQYMLEQPDQYSYRPGFPYTVSPGWVLAGFDREWDDKAIAEACDEKGPVPKPEECGNSACLCMYKRTYKNGLEKGYLTADYALDPSSCRIFEDVDSFLSLAYYYPSDGDVGWGDTKSQYDDLVPETAYKNFGGAVVSDPGIYKDRYNSDYSHLFIYGMCTHWHTGDIELGTQNLYLEKYQGQKTYIFISYYDKDLLKDRIRSLKDEK